MKVLSSLIALLAVATWAAPSYAQSKRISGDSWFGCVSKDQHGRLTSMAVSGDREAFKKGLGRAVLSGECVLFRSGQGVYLQDTSLFSGLVQVRPAGDSEAYWTNLEAVK